MSRKLKVDIRTSQELFGGEAYTVHIDITNLANQTMEGISVSPQYLPGSLVHELPTDNELDELKRRKKRIIEEMELQARLASIQSTFKKIRNPITKINYLLSLEMARFLSLKETTFFFRAKWAREFIRIDDWGDIERLEKTYINSLEEASSVKIAFLLDKQKLQEIQNKMIESEQLKKGQTNNLKDTYSIQPGESISFTYKAKSPLLLRAKTYSLQFNISYNQNNGTATTFSSHQSVSFYPSPFAIPAGAIVGAIIGYMVKIGLMNSNIFMWSNFLGSIALAIIFALLTVRTSTSKKVITTEDFVGGLILGALVGISSEAVLDKLKIIVSKP